MDELPKVDDTLVLMYCSEGPEDLHTLLNAATIHLTELNLAQTALV